MAHIEDRWFRTVVGADGRRKRERTSLHGKGLRYRVRYIDPSGRERSKSFPDKEKHEAEDFLISVENAKRLRTYVDPDAGSVGFATYAKLWFAAKGIDPSSREGYQYRIDHHLVPFFDDRPIKSVQPETINEWGQWLIARGYEASTRAVSFTILKSIFASAVENQRILANPCTKKSVNVPRRRPTSIVPWPRSYVIKIRSALRARYRALVDLGAGCGLRQGEIFGLAETDLDFDRRTLTVQRQVKRVRNHLVFGLPKSDKTRTIPLPDSVAKAVRAHMDEFKPVAVTLPWEDPDADELATVSLIFTTRLGKAFNKAIFNQRVWGPARARTGIAHSRSNGMHALRHHYASVLIDAGESIKVVSANLGHADPAFTWRVYVHLIKGSEDRTRQAIDRLAEQDENGRRPEDGLDDD